MNVSMFPSLVFSSGKAWSELDRAKPSIAKVFVLLVLPLSLLPPIMLYHAGSQHGAAFFPNAPAEPWGLLAITFFLAEMATFGAMGWAIKALSANHDAEINLHDAYLLAAIGPVPMWLSSLSLFVPSVAFCIAASLVALSISAAIIYHGTLALCHMHDEVIAANIAVEVVAAGGLAWLFLILLVVLPIVLP